ncbi:MAG: DUF4115 domain-containing protein [Endomicrobium sp.]|jgi:cytoskeletal protein RodZ|nr:DUF4115 domain-containing protein [Endomicrobium sp.]
MRDVMEEIGKILKEKRKEKNVLLAEVYKVTKIHEKYLSAIEDGDISVFLAEIYYKGFVRSYAKYLGFDSEELLNKYNVRKHFLEKESVEKEKSLTAGNEFIKKLFQKGKVSVKKLLIMFTIVVVLLVLFLYINKNMSTNVSSSIETLQQTEMSELKVLDDKNTTEETVVVVKEEKNKVPINTKQELVVEALSNVWIKINSDGRTIFEGTVFKDNKKSWKANKSFTLKTGYAPGLKVFFNGNQVDIVSGAVQDVNTIVLKK